MKAYSVKVNGKDYYVEIEPAAGHTAPSPRPIPTPSVQSPPPAPAGDGVINSPMPGTILSLQIQVGDTVSKGQVLMILEAMKMENEILAPLDGTVSEVSVSKGSVVETGAVLATITSAG